MLTHLVIGNAALHCEDILRKCPNVTVVELEGSTLLTRETTLSHSLAAVAECCPNVTEVRSPLPAGCRSPRGPSCPFESGTRVSVVCTSV
jgi:hypothetical protein